MIYESNQMGYFVIGRGNAHKEQSKNQCFQNSINIGFFYN